MPYSPDEESNLHRPGLFPHTRTSWFLAPEPWDKLFRNYQRPLLAFLGKMYFKLDDVRTDDDYVQGFFEHMIQSDFLSKVDRAKGRFRSLLLTSFKNYLKDEYRKWKAKRRGIGFFGRRRLRGRPAGRSGFADSRCRPGV